jgi:hypothetical protein
MIDAAGREVDKLSPTVKEDVADAEAEFRRRKSPKRVLAFPASNTPRRRC